MDHDVPLALSIAIPLVLFAAPTLLLLYGWRAQQGRRGTAVPRVAFRRVAKSTFAFAIAYNLAFLVQELGLVVPKAFVPGLEPVLYHNNHGYTAADPVHALLQGGGFVALLVMALVCSTLLQRDPPRHAGGRLLLAWLTFWAWVMALIQLPGAVIDPNNDLAMAFAYLGYSPTIQIVLGVLGVIGIPIATRSVVPDFLAVGPQPVNRPTRRMVRMVVMPALLGLPLIALFQIPGDLNRLLVNPAIMTVVGVMWLMAWSWMVRADERGVAPARNFSPIPWRWVAATGVLIAGFQLVLRPGIAF